MNAKDWRQQAAHFDEAPPFLPGSGILRETGFRYQYILKDVLIAQTLGTICIEPGARVLDVGSGPGVLLDRIGASYETSGFGVDISRESLKRAKLESIVGIQASLADGRRLPFADNSFDVALSLDVLEHIEFPREAVSEMVRVIRPGGTFLCYAVSKRNQFTFNWFLTAILDRLRVDHWSWSCHDPDLLVDPNAIYTHLVAGGCTVSRYEPFHAFFTILFDQVLLVCYWLGSRLGLIGRFGKARRALATRVLGISTLVCRVVIGALNRCDSPWIRRGLSNGFLLVATKQAVDARILHIADESSDSMARHHSPKLSPESLKGS